MIVDDDQFNCNILQSFLTLHKFKDWEENTVLANDGMQAVSHIQQALE